MATAYIALGSNLGDRAATLLAAVRELNATPEIAVTRLSKFHDTAPVGGPADQPRFLNAAAELSTTLDPAQLLAALLAIEQKFGRIRREKDGPRTLDLDLLLFNSLIRPSPDPVVPHPRMGERRFVLAPLAEIAATVAVPGIGKTVAEMLDGLDEGSPHPPAPYPIKGEGVSIQAFAPPSPKMGAGEKAIKISPPLSLYGRRGPGG